MITGGCLMGDIVHKDSKNRINLGVEVEATHFKKEIDAEGKIVLTPLAFMPKKDFEEIQDKMQSSIVLNDVDRDRFVAALMKTPPRNEAFTKAKSAFKKKYK